MLLILRYEIYSAAILLPIVLLILLHDAGSAAILLLIVLYEADAAAILLHILQYNADSAAILPFLLLYVPISLVSSCLFGYEIDSAAIPLVILV